MHQTNPTEMFRERHLALLREAQNRHLARQLRAARSKERPRSDRRMAGFERAIALWGRVSTPFFGS
jgi:hypothetical protein